MYSSKEVVLLEVCNMLVRLITLICHIVWTDLEDGSVSDSTNCLSFIFIHSFR